MKKINLVFAVCITMAAFLIASCDKAEDNKGLGEKLDNNTIMFDGKKLQIYAAGKYGYVSPSCTGQGILGGFYLNAANSNRDTVEISIDNIKEYSGNKNLVERGIPGSTCSLTFIGRYKPAGTIGGGVTIKSIFSGSLKFNGSTCIFDHENIGVNVPPQMNTYYAPLISYDCYWKCTF